MFFTMFLKPWKVAAVTSHGALVQWLMQTDFCRLKYFSQSLFGSTVIL